MQLWWLLFTATAISSRFLQQKQLYRSMDMVRHWVLLPVSYTHLDVYKRQVQSAETVNNIYYLVNAIPVITCILELIGIGIIFNLDKEKTAEMYAELEARRKAAAQR